VDVKCQCNTGIWNCEVTDIVGGDRTNHSSEYCYLRVD
jgi:hypothetical protein